MPDEAVINYLRRKCLDVRRDIIQMIYAGGSGHPGGSLSAVEILTALYFHVMRIRPEQPDWLERDRFILSKGHAAPAIYAVLAERGFFPVEELKTFTAPGTRLQKHIDMYLVPGTELSTGSLGQGLSVPISAISSRLERSGEALAGTYSRSTDTIGISAGLALSGKTVFCGTFAVFFTQRVCDQVVISVAYCRANVKLMGVEGGLASAHNGAFHQAMLDLAIMRAIPNMTVFVAGDATETRAIVEYMLEHPGPAYMRVSRGRVPVLLDPDAYRFEAGKAITMREGSDLTIITCGIMLPRSLQAAEELAAEGISAGVINMSSIKPLDEELILEAACDTGCIVTAENHNILGGLGSAVAEVVASRHPVPVIRVGIKDTFGEVGTPGKERTRIACSLTLTNAPASNSSPK